MSDLKRLHDILDTLPPQQVLALLTLLENTQPISDVEFNRILAGAETEEVDEQSVARVLAAEAEPGENLAHEQVKQRLGL